MNKVIELIWTEKAEAILNLPADNKFASSPALEVLMLSETSKHMTFLKLWTPCLLVATHICHADSYS